MRSLVVNLYQNLGTAMIGNNLLVTGYPVTKIGKQSWSLDSGDQLTKIKPSDLTVEFTDPTGSAWTFIQTQLASTNALYPPYITLTVDSNIVFTGIIDPTNIVQHNSASGYSIELSAQDWSIELANQYLAGWQRPNPTSNNAKSSYPFTGYSAYGEIINYHGINQYNNYIFFVGDATQAVSPGDQISFQTNGVANTYNVIDVILSPSYGWQALAGIGYLSYASLPNWVANGSVLSAIVLSNTPWPTAAGSGGSSLDSNSTIVGGGGNVYSSFYQKSFTVQAANTTANSYFTVLAKDNAHSYIYLDSVNGIIPGDILCCVNGTYSATYTVLAVNPEACYIYVKEDITNLDPSANIRIYFDTDTANDVVMTDVRTILTKATLPFNLDLSRFTQAQTIEPIFGFVSSQPYNSNSCSLSSISDMEPTLTGCNLISGITTNFTGNIDSGWTSNRNSSYPATLHADWTNQLLSAPSSLMFYETKTLSANARWRNIAYNNFSGTGQDNGPTPNTGSVALISGFTAPYTKMPSGWIDSTTTSNLITLPALVFYDYLSMRRLTVASNTAQVVSSTWNGTGWNTGTNLTWRFTNKLSSISNFPTGPAGSILGVTIDGKLEIDTGSAMYQCNIPSNIVNPELAVTPYGAYLISSSAYAKINYSGTTLSITPAVFDVGTVSNFYPNTFVAINSTQCFILGGLTTQDNSGSTISQTWSYLLSSTPAASANKSIALSEPIREGFPIFAQAMRDPSKTGRIIGHLGGSVFQVDTVVPYCVERFNPSGQTALSVIEHASQLQNCMAYPLPNGTMKIISRNNSETATNITNILQTKIDNTLCWPDFYSITLVETQDGTYYADTLPISQGGTNQDGGKLLTISGHPMVWHVSQAQAMSDALSMWFGKPRSLSNQSWTYPDSTTATPWDSLQPFQLLTINGSIQYRLMSLENDYINGTADVTLIQN